MSKYTELILKYSDRELTTEDAIKAEKIIRENEEAKKEFALNKHLDKYMRGKLLKDHSESDPAFGEVDTQLKNEIAQLAIKSQKDKSLSFFINSSMVEQDKLIDQVDEAEREAYLTGADKQTMDWVEKWEAEKANMDKYTLEIAQFVKSGMNDINNIQPIAAPKRIRASKKIFIGISSIAASIVLALTLWAVLKNQKGSSELFADYYQPYPIIDGQTRNNSDLHLDKVFKTGVNHYKAGNFSDAALQFEETLELEEGSEKVQLLLGITQIEMGKYNNAIDNFNKIIAKNADYSIEAKWYLAMCYLKMDDSKKAVGLLKELSGIPGFYMEKSKDLLEKLE